MAKLLHASAAHRWAYCPGSVTMCLAVPKTTSPEAQKGIAAHAYGADLLRTWATAKPGDLDAESVRSAEWYAHLVISDRRKIAANSPLYVEMRSGALSIHPEFVAVTDACWTAPGGAWKIYDYKSGHEPVEAFENWQLISTAAGLAGALPDGTEIELIIAQLPEWRDETYQGDRWLTTVGKLRPYWDQLRGAAENAVSASPRLEAGEHCRRCPAASMCPQSRTVAETAAVVPTLAVPELLTGADVGAELGRLYDAQGALERRIEALEAEAVARIGRSEYVHGFEVRPTEGRQKWLDTVDAATLCEIATVYGIDAMGVSLTPKQAIKAGIPTEVIDGLSETPAGAPKLVRVTEKDARRAFK